MTFSALKNNWTGSRAIKIGLVALVVIGVAWRLCRYFLQMPVWGDEAMLCLHFFDRGYAGLAQPLVNAQVCPILFLWSEYTAFKLAGSSELALRLLPVLAGIGALFGFVRFARSAQPPVAALLAAGILAVSYYPVRHSCEIKPYSFDLLASVILLGLAAAWLRRPEDLLPKVLLILFTPAAIMMSYPSVFVAGGISLALLPGMIRRRDTRDLLFFAGYNVLMVSAFFIVMRSVTSGQYEHTGKYMAVFWADAFPPGKAWDFIKWFARIHTGNMMAYPVGGRNGGSIATLVFVLIGVWELIRRRAFSFLTLLLAPFFLTFIAAALHRYPYGESARVAQHLAPAICLLMGGGIAVLLFREGRGGGADVKKTGVACALLAAIGIGGILRDLHKPYKTPDDDRVRKIVAGIFSQARTGDQVTVGGHRIDAPVNFQWYLRRHDPDVEWEGRLNIDRLRTRGGGVWRLDFALRTGGIDDLRAQLAQTGRKYRQLSFSEETLRIGPLEMPLNYCSVAHWTEESK